MNKNIKFIYDLFNNLIENEFKCNRKEMIDEGEIFYFNGDNGSQFDWYENHHTSILTTIYPDGMEAVKIHIYNDGTIKAYYYKKGSMNPDNTLTTLINKDIAKNIAIILYIISDKENLFDKRLNSLNLEYELNESDIKEFESYNI